MVPGSIAAEVIENRRTFETADPPTDLGEPTRRRLPFQPDRRRQGTPRLLLGRRAGGRSAASQRLDHGIVEIANENASHGSIDYDDIDSVAIKTDWRRLTREPERTINSLNNQEREAGSSMRITSKGHVTIPAKIREQAGLLPHTEVEFVLDGDSVRIVRSERADAHERGRRLLGRLRRSATVRMSTDEIMALTRTR